MQLVIWILFYLAIWTLYNSYFKWKMYRAGKKQYLLSTIFFLLSAVAFNFIFYKYTRGSISTLILALIVSIGIGFFFSTFFPFYKHIKNGRYFLVSMPSDIFFQQLMIITAIKILSQYFGANYIDLYFGLFFALTHLPIIFFKWARLRYLIVILTLIGGTAFSYLIRNNGQTGVFASSLLHFLMYIPIFYYLRDERIV